MYKRQIAKYPVISSLSRSDSIRRRASSLATNNVSSSFAFAIRSSTAFRRASKSIAGKLGRTRDCAVAAEPFPPVLARLIGAVERRIRAQFPAADVPSGWHLNTCLINFYGRRRDGEAWVDVARVGDHRDFEPGPVASISLGARALFQFVRRGAVGGPPVRTQWLEDGSLQAFGGAWWKDELLHRVQRVEDKAEPELPPSINGFRSRRVNFTFRYVPDAHVVPYAALGAEARADVEEYVAELARASPFFRRALDASSG